MPVVEVDLTDEQCRALNVALNRIHGEWDVPKLAEILKALPQDLAALTGFDDDAIQRVLHDAEEAIRAMQAEEDLDAVPAPPDEATTKPGDLIVLGRHRLLCGDAGSEEDLDRLLDGAPVHLVNTDPPYNVKVEPRSNNAIAAGLSSFTPGAQMHHQGAGPGAAPLEGPRDPREAPPEGPAARERLHVGRGLRRARSSRGSGTWPGSSSRGARSTSGAGTRTSRTTPRRSRPASSTSRRRSSGTSSTPSSRGRTSWVRTSGRSTVGSEGAAHQFFGPPNATDLWDVRKVNPQAMVHLTEKPVELAARAIAYSSKPRRERARPLRRLGLHARSRPSRRGAGRS